MPKPLEAQSIIEMISATEGAVFVPVAAGGALPEWFDIELAREPGSRVLTQLQFSVVAGEIRFVGRQDHSCRGDRTGLDALRAADLPGIRQGTIDTAIEFATALATRYKLPTTPRSRHGAKRGPAGPADEEVAYVVALRDIDGLSFREIGEKIAVSKATAARWYNSWFAQANEETSK